MKYNIIEYPVKHILIENFLSEEDLINCMDELMDIKSKFDEGRFYNGKFFEINHDRKKCLNLNLYDMYEGFESESFMLNEVIAKKMWSKEMRAIYDQCGTDSVFSYMNDTDYDTAIIAGFRDGDYYNWHKDLGVTTANIMLSYPDNNIEGGAFHLSNMAGEGSSERLIGTDYNTIKHDFVPGNVVIFPSRFKHKVDIVNIKDNQFKNFRFTIQSRCYITNF